MILKSMQFFEEYFIKPIYEGTGYNIYNTAVYAILLVVAVVLVYKLLRKMNVSIDRKFLFGILPFVALGGIFRSLEDLYTATGAAKNILMITPLIYVSVFALALASLMIARIIEKYKKIEYHKTWFVVGIIIAIIGVAQMRIADAHSMLLMLSIFGGWAIAFGAAKFIAIKKFPKLNAFLSKENTGLLLAHLFDATTTFVAIQFLPYFEQHVLTGFIMTTFGAAFVFVTKLVVVSVVLFVFDKELAQEKQKNMFLKVVVLILGLGPGLRNFFRIVMGV
jgi:uncharacterized membrane protein